MKATRLYLLTFLVGKNMQLIAATLGVALQLVSITLCMCVYTGMYTRYMQVHCASRRYENSLVGLL